MITMKKLLLSLILVLLLTSCGTDQMNEPMSRLAAQTTEPAEETANPTEGPDEAVVFNKSSNGTTLAGILTISSMHGIFYLEPAAKAFMKENPGVKITIHKYKYDSPEDISKFEQIPAAVMAGTADDIIENGNSNIFGIENRKPSIFSLAEQDLLTDFYSLIGDDESFSLDDYYANVFDMRQYNGGLYVFPLSCFQTLVTINRNAPDFIISQFEQLEQISYEEMYNLYLQMQPLQTGLYFEAYFDPQEALMAEYSRFIDSAKRVCYFDNDKFLHLIQTYKNIFNLKKPEEEPVRWTSEAFRADSEESLQYTYKIIDVSEAQYFFPYEENNFIHPIPLVNGNGKALSQPYIEYYIPSASKNQTLAWEFLKYMSETSSDELWQMNLGTSVNNNPYVINRNTYRDNMETYLRSFITGSLNKRFVLPTTVNRPECIQSIIDLTDSYRGLPMENQTASYLAGDTVSDEFDLYLNNSLTAEQAVENIQSKLTAALLE